MYFVIKFFPKKDNLHLFANYAKTLKPILEANSPTEPNPWKLIVVDDYYKCQNCHFDEMRLVCSYTFRYNLTCAPVAQLDRAEDF